MNAITIPEKMEQSIHEAESLFEQTAIARAEAENADERRKQTEAVMFIKFKDEGCSAAEAEKRAKAAPEYRKAADDWMAANLTWRTLEGRARGKELRFEAWRSANAMARAQMQLR